LRYRGQSSNRLAVDAFISNSSDVIRPHRLHWYSLRPCRSWASIREDQVTIVRPSKDQPHSTKSDREDDYNYYNCSCLFPVHVTSHSVSVDQIQVR